MKQPIKQMLTALAIGAVIFTAGFALVGAGTEKEQAEQPVVVTEETVATTTTTAPKESVYYYDSVPLDKDLQNYIIRECRDNGIDPAVVMAMIDRESGYDINEVGDNGNSFCMCQIQPKWHHERMQRLGCTDLFDPYQNVTVCIDYLCELLNKYGDMAKALVAYNQGHYKGTITEYAKAVLDGAERIGERNAVDE